VSVVSGGPLFTIDHVVPLFPFLKPSRVFHEENPLHGRSSNPPEKKGRFLSLMNGSSISVPFRRSSSSTLLLFLRSELIICRGIPSPFDSLLFSLSGLRKVTRLASQLLLQRKGRETTGPLSSFSPAVRLADISWERGPPFPRNACRVGAQA